MKPAEFLEYASSIATVPLKRPAEYRSAISRAYYAAFLLARDVLNERFRFYCKSANEHQWVQWHFYNCKNESAKELGKLLGNLHEARKQADYDLNNTAVEIQKKAIFECQKAEDIKNLLSRCVVQESTIKAEMIVFRTKTGIS